MAPESALTDFSLRAGADGPNLAGGGVPFEQRLRDERELLIRWAREIGFTLPAEDYRLPKFRTHGEHHVFYDEESDRFMKITHGWDRQKAGFALTVEARFSRFGKVTQNPIYAPSIREATPLEYLARLRLFNRTFLDSVEVEGVIDEPGSEAIVISQRYITGSAAPPVVVREFMSHRGFAEVPGVIAGRRDSISYFRSADRVAVFDTHPENFLSSGPETVPIDALIIHANDDLTTFLSMSPHDRSAEIGLWASVHEL